MLAQIRENYIETGYTLEDARKIIRYEDKRKTERKKETALYYLKQKTAGIIMAAIGIAIPFIMDGDATASLICVPLGLWLLFTKERVMTF